MSIEYQLCLGKYNKMEHESGSTDAVKNCSLSWTVHLVRFQNCVQYSNKNQSCV